MLFKRWWDAGGAQKNWYFHIRKLNAEDFKSWKQKFCEMKSYGCKILRIHLLIRFHNKVKGQQNGENVVLNSASVSHVKKSTANFEIIECML